MHRLFSPLFVVALIGPALASQPGQPLDCEDWVILEPGVTCGWDTPPGLDWRSYLGGFGNRRVVDAQGRTLQIRRVLLDPPQSCGATSDPRGRTEIVRSDSNGDFVVAYTEDRCEQSEWGGTCTACVADLAHFGTCSTGDEPGWFGDINFDLVNGRLLVGASSQQVGRDCSGIVASYILSFSGFTTLFDLIETFDSRPATVGLAVPQRPEGLRAADSFDTYWGPVTRPLDLSQAQPAQCAYPDHQPQVGEYLTFPDAAPTPAPGNAIYYLTSVTYQGQTRAGRQAIDGRLSGRDASQLPVCDIAR